MIIVKHPQGKYSFYYDEYDKIGEGTFSYVYKGILQYPNLKKIPVAVKILRENIIDQKYVARQVEVLSTTQHPNIMKFYEYLNLNQRVYYITQLCKCNLETMIKQKKLKDENNWLIVYNSLLEALFYLHYNQKVQQKNQNQCITHRDIKPSNILFNANGQIKLCDFGLARIMMRQERSIKNSTQIGTIKYMSPEIIMDQPYNSKCDLWSLGAVLYEIITGACLISKQAANNRLSLTKQIKKVEGKIETNNFSKFKYGNVWKQALTNLLKRQSEKRWDVLQAKYSIELSKALKMCQTQKQVSKYGTNSDLKSTVLRKVDKNKLNGINWEQNCKQYPKQKKQETNYYRKTLTLGQYMKKVVQEESPRIKGMFGKY